MKERYHKFCQQNKDLPIFFQDWYLDATCIEGTWDVAIVEKGHQPAGVLPYYLKKKGPFQYITMPPLTKMMGPFVTASFRKEPKFTNICKDLIKQLPAVDYFEQTCAYEITNWLPFYWNAFQQTTRYSFLLDLEDLEKVYAGFASNYRNNKMKKAKATVKIVRDLPLEAFYRVNKLSFDRQNIAVPYSLAFVKQLDKVLQEHQSRTIFFAVDKQEQIHSVAYVIWDNQRAYYLMAGDNPDLRGSGASILLVWEIIQFVRHELGLKEFDFQGSMIQGIERVRRQFGAQQVPYFLIQRRDSKLFNWFSSWKGRLRR